MNDAKPINADDVIKFIQHAIKIVLYVIAGIVRVTGVKSDPELLIISHTIDNRRQFFK